MKLLMTADAVGGVWTYALELVAGLRARDVEVHLAVMGPPADTAQLNDAARCGAAAIYRNDAALEWMPDPWADLDAAGDWLLDLAARVRPDLVHLNSYVHAACEWETPVVCVGHSCVLSWWEAVKGEPAPPGWERYRDAVARGLSAASTVVAPSRWMLDELTRLYGAGEGRVIHNGLDLPAGSAGCGEGDRLVVTAGRLWDEAKNAAAVLEAAPELRWPVVVAGADVDGVPNATGLGRLPRRDLLEQLATAGLFVLPARYEPFGLGPLEAALSGCALVLGDIPSLRELWEGAAIFVDPTDPVALRDTCNDLIEEPRALARWAERARRHASSYSRAAMADAYLELYRHAVRPLAESSGVRS